MPLTETTLKREHLNTRAIIVNAYRREDGLYDLEGHLSDIQTRTFTLKNGTIRKAGEPFHEMWLRITLDRTLIIQDVEAQSDAHPYPGDCGNITPDYKKLKGLMITSGFMASVHERLGGIHGCTHLTELVRAIAQTVFQTLAGELMSQSISLSENAHTYVLDKCHALKRSGSIVKRYYPKEYQKPK